MVVKSKDGFTLIEVLITISIVAIFCLIFSNLLIDSIKIWSGEGDYISCNQRGEIALKEITHHLKRARDIKISKSNNDWIQFRGYYKNEGLKWITYRLYLSNDESAIGIQVGEEKGQGTIMPIINGVSGLEFEDVNDDLSLIKVVITVPEQNGEKRRFSTCVAPGS